MYNKTTEQNFVFSFLFLGIPFLIVSGSFIGLLLVFLLIPNLFNTFITTQENNIIAGITDANQLNYVSNLFEELENTRIAIFRSDVVRSISFLLLAIAVLFGFIRGLLNEYAFAGVLALLIILDLGLVDKRYLSTEEKGNGYEQWVENWKQIYPYTAGTGDNEIYNREIQENPQLQIKIDSVLNAVKVGFSKEMSPAERTRKIDWYKFRAFAINDSANS